MQQYRDFALWLEGVLDMNPLSLNAEQVSSIKNKLKELKASSNAPKMRC